MLSIGPMSGGQESYYGELAREDYYTEGGEPPGKWWGRSAPSLGVYGTVGRPELANLFQGLSADGSQELVKNARSKDRRAGFDLTFSAPKSVSVLWSQANADIRTVIQEAHDEAVSRALGYVEDVAARTRRGHGGSEQVQAGFVAAIFQHSTARADGHSIPDPQLHSHCLVLNVCVGEDGKTGTLDGRPIFRHKMTAGALYRAELLAQIERRLGLQASKDGRFAELHIVPKDLRELFSKRSQAIATYMEEQGLAGAKEAARATLDTRSTKPEVDRATLLSQWQEIGRERGFSVTPEMIIEALQTAPERDEMTLLAEGIATATERITERESYFAERELLRFTAEELEGKGVGILPIRLAVENHLRHSKDIVALGESDTEKRFTTVEMLEVEKRMLDGAARLAKRQHQIASLEEVFSERPTIKDEQRKAVEHVTKGSAISVLSGMAGTGKTYLLDAAREAWEAEGYQVLGCALAGSAAKRLEEGSRIRSENIHRTLKLIEQGKVVLGDKSVLVVDEAGMVGTRQMERLIAEVEKGGAKLVLVGDERQLGAIDAGSPFRILGERLGAARLIDITRQDEDWAKESVRHFASGEAHKALAAFKDRGLFYVGTDRSDAITQLVEDWKGVVERCMVDKTLVLTGTNAEAVTVNQRIQKERYRAGELESGAVETGRYLIHKGDRVIFRRNSALVTNGDTGVITKISEEKRTLTAKLDNGKRVTIELDRYSDVQLGYAATTHVAQGATLNGCLVLCGGAMQDRELTYVQASRARFETRLYTDVVNAGEELRDIASQMERSRQKEMAHDVLERQALETDFDLDMV